MTPEEKSQQRISTVLVLSIITLFMLAMCSGCSTVVPVTAKFPDAPGRGAATACPDLKKLPDAVTLSEVSRTVNQNYTLYYECAVKLDAWLEWYNTQRTIFDHAGK